MDLSGGLQARQEARQKSCQAARRPFRVRPGCQEAFEEGSQAARRPVWRAARLPGGLSGELPGSQDACLESFQAAKRPVWRAARLPGEPRSGQRSKLFNGSGMGLDLLYLFKDFDNAP